MSQEIIYTSSPQGLRPGSFGFCTVATTPGMATTLAERLESLSGYRHAHPPGDPRAAQNPVVFSHLVLKVGGQRLNVLSRVADAGLDYSQRTNKLAHHVALGANELPPAGPAWVLTQPGFAETEWKGSPRILPAGRKPPSAELAPQICKAWKRATGDAGWAGVFAQHAMENKRPAHLIFPEGTDVLALLVEAQSLLPPSRRWEVSFSTYFTRMPPGLECLWRCVLAGSPEGNSAAGLRGETVIDLTQPLGRAPDGVLVEVARTGVSVQAKSTTQTHTASLLVLEEIVDEHQENFGKLQFEQEDELRLAPPPRTTRATAYPFVTELAQSNSQLNRSARTQRWIIGSLIVVATLLLATTTSLLVFILRDRVLAERVDPHKDTSAPLESNATSRTGPTSDSKVEAPSANTDPSVEQLESKNSSPNLEKSSDTPASDATSAPEPNRNPADEPNSSSPPITAAIEQKDEAQPKADSKRRGPRIGPLPIEPLKAPELTQGAGTPGQSQHPTFTLISLRTEELKETIGLKLQGVQGSTFSLRLVEKEKSLHWVVESVPMSVVAPTQKIAEIKLVRSQAGPKLHFSWLPESAGARSSCYGLMFSRLVIKLGADEEQSMQLAAPFRRPSLTQTTGDSLQSEAPFLSAIDFKEIGIELRGLEFPDSEGDRSNGWTPIDSVNSLQRDFQSTFSDKLLVRLELDLKKFTVVVRLREMFEDRTITPDLVKNLAKPRETIDNLEAEKQRLISEIALLELKENASGKQKKSADESIAQSLMKKREESRLNQENLKREYSKCSPILKDARMRAVIRQLEKRIENNDPLRINYRIVRVPKDSDSIDPIEIAVAGER